MNCNCIEQKKNEIKELMERRLQKPIESVECKLYGFKLTATGSGIALQIPFTVTANATGYRGRGKAIPFVAPFCPFCGVSNKVQLQPEKHLV